MAMKRRQSMKPRVQPQGSGISNIAFKFSIFTLLGISTFFIATFGKQPGQTGMNRMLEGEDAWENIDNLENKKPT